MTTDTQTALILLGFLVGMALGYIALAVMYSLGAMG